MELSASYVSQHGLILDTSIELNDEGISGFDGSNLEKGKLGAFLQKAKAGDIPRGSVLLVESLDRLSREQVRRATRIFNEILDHGITIVTLTDGHVYSPEKMDGEDAGMSMIMSLLTMMRAHEESSRKSERVRAAWATKRSFMDETKLTSTCPQWMRISADKKSFDLIPENVATVKRIIELQRSGVGQASIVKMFNEERVPTINYRQKGHGEGWHTSTIQKIVCNPALYGQYQQVSSVMEFDAQSGQRRRMSRPVGDPRPDYYPAIITKEEFFAVQAMREERLSRARGVKGEAFSNLFSGLLTCGYCGSTMNVIGHKPKHLKEAKRSLVCSRAKRGLGCHFIQWNYKNFEHTVMAYLEGIDFEGLIDDKRSVAREVSDLHAKVKMLSDEKAACGNRLAILFQALENGGESFASLRDRIAAIELRQRDVVVEIASAECDAKKAQAKLTDAQSLKTSVVELYAKMEKLSGKELFTLRASIAAQIRQAVERVEVFPGGVHLVQDLNSDVMPLAGRDIGFAGTTDLLRSWLRDLNEKAKQKPNNDLSRRSEILQRIRERSKTTEKSGDAGCGEQMPAEAQLEQSHDDQSRPDKSFRTAWIVGKAGKRYSTPTILDALWQEHKEKSETLAALGFSPDAEWTLRQKENGATAGGRKAAESHKRFQPAP